MPRMMIPGALSMVTASCLRPPSPRLGALTPEFASMSVVNTTVTRTRVSKELRCETLRDELQCRVRCAILRLARNQGFRAEHGAKQIHVQHSLNRRVREILQLQNG